VAKIAIFIKTHNDGEGDEYELWSFFNMAGNHDPDDVHAVLREFITQEFDGIDE